MTASIPTEGAAMGGTRGLVLRALSAGEVEVFGLERTSRYVLITKIDDDSRSDRSATFHSTEMEARAAVSRVRQGWWPDSVIDLRAPVASAVRDAAVGDGSLGEPYPFDDEHVVFACNSPLQDESPEQAG